MILQLRSMARGFLSALLSPSVLFWLFAAWVLWYVTWSIWSEEAFAAFVEMLKASALLQALFVLGLANAGYNIFRCIKERIKISALRAALWAVLPAGALVFALGFLMSATMRDEGKASLGAGGQLNPPWERKPFLIAEIDLALKDEVSDIEYNADPGLLFVNEPRMTVVSMHAPKVSARVGAYPPVKLGSTYYHILNYGLAPGLRLVDAGGAVIDEAFVMTSILPPGSMDTFEFGGGAYRMSIALEPVRVIEKGDAKARIYDLKNPLYKLTVQRADESVFEGTVRDKAVFSDGRTLELIPPEPWVRVEASTGEGLWLLAAGIVLITLGIPLSLWLAVERLVRAGRQETSQA